MALTLAPAAWFQAFDDSGVTISGALLYTYSAGTSTLLATYTDAAGAVPNANPIVCDSAGRCTIFLSPVGYKFVYKTAAGVTIRTQDNIQATPTTQPQLDVEGTAGENLTEAEAIYMSAGDGGLTAGRWYKTDADLTYASVSANALGMVVSSVLVGETVTVRIVGRMPGLSALTAGTLYYLSATAGAITSSAPANARPFAVADSTTSVILSEWIPIPDATTTLAGKVSITTQSFAGAKTFTGALTASSTLAVTGTSTLTGAVTAQGTRVNRILDSKIASTGSSSGGAVDLYTFTVPAATMSADGQTIKMVCWGTTAANGNNKAPVANFGATAVTIFSDTVNAGRFRFELHVLRTGAATQLLCCESNGANGAAMQTVVFASPAETLSGAIVIKISTATTTANNDIIVTGGYVEGIGC